jgi:hypothetical protein
VIQNDHIPTTRTNEPKAAAAPAIEMNILSGGAIELKSRLVCPITTPSSARAAATEKQARALFRQRNFWTSDFETLISSSFLFRFRLASRKPFSYGGAPISFPNIVFSQPITVPAAGRV